MVEEIVDFSREKGKLGIVNSYTKYHIINNAWTSTTKPIARYLLLLVMHDILIWINGFDKFTQLHLMLTLASKIGY